MANKTNARTEPGITSPNAGAPNDAAATAQLELETLRAELEKARAEKAEAETARRELETALQTGVTPIRGSYKGYRFTDGHKNVRNRQGELCDTEMLLTQANDGDATACAVLDWLISIQYGYLVKA